ncbi:hypothetical protein PV721_30640 [Streptomyces sp. MB09-01]|uniref:hypothetical protein n=1 Tax=Streptomyces sp. MB09-01 TaxID=3028666 RepID=UPI0029AEC66F|nr:hypothetical protein [Streptomyces sp. MB09-01]MDX3538625.1 hypothetical protein [Streptomyces sp. MB09-01]
MNDRTAGGSAAAETTLVREVFGPLGALVECGAALESVSVGAFVARHRGELDRVLDVVRRLGGFHAESMDVMDGLGYLREHDVPPVTLLMWSGCIEEHTPDLGAPETVRRMARMGADLQLAHLLQALVGVAALRGDDDVESPAREIAEVIGAVCVWGGAGGGRSLHEVVLVWRVAFLPGLLMPSSGSPEPFKRRLRAYAHALERIVEQGE